MSLWFKYFLSFETNSKARGDDNKRWNIILIVISFKTQLKLSGYSALKKKYVLRHTIAKRGI